MSKFTIAVDVSDELREAIAWCKGAMGSAKASSTQIRTWLEGEMAFALTALLELYDEAKAEGELDKEDGNGEDEFD